MIGLLLGWAEYGQESQTKYQDQAHPRSEGMKLRANLYYFFFFFFGLNFNVIKQN